ncbi:MAG: hypothetical protein NDJ89_01515 [Oligoflexia bacterium]|nr:hypothetical protein [Oligoflexia bacterium]
MARSILGFSAVFLLGCATTPVSVDGDSRTRMPASTKIELLTAIRSQIPSEEIQTWLVGTTQVKIGSKVVEARCKVELRDSFKERHTPLNYIRITGGFPRLVDLKRGAEFPEYFYLGASAGEGLSSHSEIKADYVDFETIRSSDWGGEVRERVIIEGTLKGGNLKAHFITSPLTMGFALPFDTTDATCTGLTLVTSENR